MTSKLTWKTSTILRKVSPDSAKPVRSGFVFVVRVVFMGARYGDTGMHGSATCAS